jgi:hypothetical protein
MSTGTRFVFGKGIPAFSVGREQSLGAKTDIEKKGISYTPLKDILSNPEMVREFDIETVDMQCKEKFLDISVVDSGFNTALFEASEKTTDHWGFDMRQPTLEDYWGYGLTDDECTAKRSRYGLPTDEGISSLY